jgi:hypothetical protein
MEESGETRADPPLYPSDITRAAVQFARDGSFGTAIARPGQEFFRGIQHLNRTLERRNVQVGATR